jgi:lysophospholipase L1-like esterase
MVARVRCWIATGAVLAAALLTLPQAAAADQRSWFSRAVPMRLMALGDSLSNADLARLLDAGGYRFAIVGRSRGRASRDYVIRSFSPDPAPQLYGVVTRAAIERYDPDVILLMAGTNDLLRVAERKPGYTLSNVVEGMNALLAEIFYLRPHANVIVAGAVDGPRLLACDVVDFDGIDDENGCGKSARPSLTTLVAAYAARDFHVVLAGGMSIAVPRDKAHFPDGVHPSGRGSSQALARVWMDAIAHETTDDTLAAGR